MIYAYDADMKRVKADYASKCKNYYCPGCNSALILKQGQINIPHFAHKSTKFCDAFTENKMTEWHIRHQQQFDEKCREVLLQYANKRHIADIKIGNVIVEFQHSPISSEIFDERNDFYRHFGSVVWVFDLHDADRRIYIREDDGELFFEWSHPSRMLGNYRYGDMIQSNIYVVFELSEFFYVQVLKNGDGCRYFSGDIFNGKRALHKFIMSKS